MLLSGGGKSDAIGFLFMKGSSLNLATLESFVRNDGDDDDESSLAKKIKQLVRVWKDSLKASFRSKQCC